MNHATAPRTTRSPGWIVGGRRPAAPAVRLFCLPYAAGGASIYAPWRSSFADDIELCPVELPGRQTRRRDSAFTCVDSLVDALASGLAGEFDVPYALFGHSMGSLVAFELARALRRRGVGEPSVLFVSGGRAPQLPREHPVVHDQPDAVVIAKLRSLGALPKDICDEPELVELLMPTIRADLTVCETYEYRPEPPLTCPIVAFAGADDPEVPPARMDPWREQTSGGFLKQVLPGDHFFLHSSRSALLDAVHAALAGALRQGPAARTRLSVG